MRGYDLGLGSGSVVRILYFSVLLKLSMLTLKTNILPTSHSAITELDEVEEEAEEIGQVVEPLSVADSSSDSLEQAESDEEAIAKV